MVRVDEIDDPDAPASLIVDNNPMNLLRLTEALIQRGHRIIECQDGDLAVDVFVREKPDYVWLALDIPSLDGHLVALEMRENRESARIIMLASRHQIELAQNAAYSAGAVATLQKPITKQVIDDAWEQIKSDIPSAPGLADLDELYPDLSDGGDVDVDSTNLAQKLPPPPSAKLLPPPNKKRRFPWKILALLLFTSAIGAIGYGAYLQFG